MSTILNPDNEFLRRVNAVTEENLSDEHFGVSELATTLSTSRSSLLRKIKKLTGVSVSIYIRKIRLHHARQLLDDDSLTASEIAYRVGFNSTSYFTKCFREEFGYTPGIQKKIGMSPDNDLETLEVGEHNKRIWVWASVIIVGVIVAVSIFKLFIADTTTAPLDKTIAVLPFKNDSGDSANIYIINGLMEAILSNLQKVEDLQVTSRTTVERYRNSTPSIPELARELGVNYFVEGSGQKLGNRIVLTVQLIEATTDRHIWSKRYERDADDIFQLQMDVARNIAGEIEAIITPEEQKMIEKIPTDNLVAYDHYLKGIDFSQRETSTGLVEAVAAFKEAIKEDEGFAQAYAYIAICYYYMDIYQANKRYGEEINLNADKAILLDPELAESQYAKGLAYMHHELYQQAIPYFEKALVYSPNSGQIHNFLSDIYTSYIPDTGKYLKHALQGIKTATASQDSVTASYSYLHLSNALAQTGFVREAEQYIQKSLDLNPANLFSAYLHTYIKFAGHSDLERTKRELILIWKRDTTRLDILQEIGKVCYTQESYEEAWQYYERFIKYKQLYDLNIYDAQDLTIGFVLEKLGRQQLADSLYAEYEAFIVQDESIYSDLMKAGHYAVHGEVERGMQHFKAFTSQTDYIYWVILFLDKDPVLMKLSGHPDYEKTIRTITDNFWKQHRQTRKMLEEEGVI
jgi:TolB-like protein/AraC-like DNA-binding protein/tetratricopeptide (TPR) repeat protein